MAKKKEKPRNPYVETCRKYFKEKTIPDKKHKKNKEACRGKVSETE